MNHYIIDASIVIQRFIQHTLHNNLIINIKHQKTPPFRRAFSVLFRLKINH
jgi:hypothetical protein